jgi:phosphoenolpyruvate carboxykinase (GTP)
MLIPPESYRKRGYKVWCVGDDISWIRKGPDGRLYAINPENGFFGVAPGTNMKSNPNAMESTRRDTIFTNVAHNLDNNTVWWEGMDKNPPANGVDWQGNPWNGKTAETPGAHPNSRFTAPARNCPCISGEFESLRGVPISAFVFGGRRAKLAPLVYQAFDWNHGVFVGSIMGSETTAAASGLAAGVRRDPMAMLPFCGYNMADYFQHWIDVGAGLDPEKAPKFFNVNWFRKDGEGNFLWPGFGDNLRVLDWILARCEGKAGAEETAIGYVPCAGDINLEGVEDKVSPENLRAMLDVDPALWKAEAEGVAEFYAKFEGRVPAALTGCLEQLRRKLGKE